MIIYVLDITYTEIQLKLSPSLP